MIDLPTLLLYLPVMLAIVLAPGSDTLFVVGSALRGGSRGGVIAACGVITGGIVHIGFAVVGLSALLLHSAIAFSVVKYLGAAYLIYLGVRALIAREGGHGPSTAALSSAALASARRDTMEVFIQGFITNVLNPKVALFILAFLPQFVSPARGAIWSQLLELGALMYIAGLIYLGTVGFVVGRVRRFGSPSGRIKAAFRYVTATIFIALGIRVAVTE